MDPTHLLQARSFGMAARRYDRYRPTYAEDAVVWALGQASSRVVDLGAGTGILSRQLRRLGHEVVAVEPDDLMRACLVEVSPGVIAVAGRAEAIPLADNSVDAVVAGQSYHWFDQARAHQEIARVIRPGGTFAAMWNDADPSVPWTVRFSEIIDGATRTGRPVADFGDRFTPAELGEFRHDMWVTPEHLVVLATTRSPYLVADEQGRRDLISLIRALLRDHGLTDLERVAMPHITRVNRAFRQSIVD
jgi:SAM-dependent methyltransferase